MKLTLWTVRIAAFRQNRDTKAGHVRDRRNEYIYSDIGSRGKRQGYDLRLDSENLYRNEKQIHRNQGQRAWVLPFDPAHNLIWLNREIGLRCKIFLPCSPFLFL